MEMAMEKQFYERLASIETKVDGINSRLDTLNGSVKETKIRVTNLEKQDIRDEARHVRQDAGWGYVVKYSSQVLVMLLGAYLIYKLGI